MIFIADNLCLWFCYDALKLDVQEIDIQYVVLPNDLNQIMSYTLLYQERGRTHIPFYIYVGLKLCKLLAMNKIKCGLEVETTLCMLISFLTN